MRLRFLCLAAAMALPALAQAQSTPVSGQQPVTASVVYSCVINTAGALNFGTYDPADVNGPGGQPLRTTTDISIRCTKGTNNVPIVYFSEGEHGVGGSAAERNMANAGGEKLNYRLFNAASYAANNELKSTDDSTGIEFYLDPAAANSTVHGTLYGQVDAGQNVTAADYSDTVMVTLEF